MIKIVQWKADEEVVMAKAKKEDTQVQEKDTVKAANDKSISIDTIAEAFERRFDYLSARTVMKEALSKLGLGDKTSLTKEEVGKLAGLLPELEEGMAPVVEALNNLLK